MDEKIVKDFLLRIYFGEGRNHLVLAINRAYRDFNRTLRNLPKDVADWESVKKKLSDALGNEILALLQTKIINQEEFTLWHQKTCYNLRTSSNEILSIGQSQKWVNMTLKYLLTFGDEYVPGITTNYRYFHVPIDNIIQDKFEKGYSIPKFIMPWSRIPDYDSYHKYQIAIRDAIGQRVPIEVEFELFNG